MQREDRESPENLAGLNHHPAAKLVLDGADDLDSALAGVHELDETGAWYSILEQVPTIMRREAHLTTARYLSMIQEGLPVDTAEMLAQDDMGFQLVRGLCPD